MILNQKAIADNLDEWSKVVEKSISVEDLSSKVRQMLIALGEHKSAKEPHESILVYPFPSQIAGGEQYSSLTGIACELTIGPEVYLTSKDAPTILFDPSAKSAQCSPYFSIKPGEFAVLITHEYVYLPPNIMGFLSIRNSYKKRGLINVSGFHVDPGFHGRLIFTVYNAGPGAITLEFRDRVFMLMFAELTGETTPYEYKDTKAQKFRNGTDQLKITSDILGDLQGPSVSPLSLHERLRRVETIINVLFIPLTAALIIAVITILVKG
jgi:dCTP deaminase